MEYLEAMSWLSTVDLAKKGDKEMKQTLKAENKRRKENGQPTVEQELNSLIEQGKKIKSEKE